MKAKSILILVLCLATGVPVAAADQARDVTMARERTLLNELNKGVGNPKDVKWVEEVFKSKSSDVGVSGVALLCLTRAVKIRALGYDKYRSLLLEFGAHRNAAAVQGACREMLDALGLDRPTRDVVTKRLSISETHPTPGLLSRVEMEFVSNCLKDRSVGNRAEGGMLLCGRYGLRGPQKKWATDRLEQALVRSSGGVRKLWSFYLAMFKERNQK